MPHSSTSCGVEGCGRDAILCGFCNMHYRRLRRLGSTGEAGSRLRTGNDVGYQAVHRRLRVERGRAADQICRCGAPARHWAYLPGGDDPLQRTENGLTYSTDLSLYLALCQTCHLVEDGNFRGEQNGATKLTEDAVKEIRRRYDEGSISQGQLALEFGVSQPNVSMIVHRQVWEHVQ